MTNEEEVEYRKGHLKDAQEKVKRIKELKSILSVAQLEYEHDVSVDGKWLWYNEPRSEKFTLRQNVFDNDIRGTETERWVTDKDKNDITDWIENILGMSCDELAKEWQFREDGDDSAEFTVEFEGEGKAHIQEEK